MTTLRLHSRRRFPARRGSQRGQAVLLVVMLVGMAAALLVYGMVDTTAIELRRNRDTAAALSEVKRALIGWSVQRDPALHGSNARPGELPCPDMNNDGFEDGSCVAGALGRVPWKTLGIPEPKDSAGETLWYSIAGPFRIWNMNNTIIDSDTKGNLPVYQDSTATVITAEAIAVIFSPGAVLGAQIRDCTGDPNVPNCQATRICTGPTYTLTALCNPANFLETAAGVNNASTNGPFISAQSSSTFNDKVMAITTTDLMPVVERRVAREMIDLLTKYRALSGCACYPWAADNFDDDSVNGRRRGMVPMEDAEPHTWASLGIFVPTWIAGSSPNNKWGRLFYYAIAPIDSAGYVPTGDPAVDLLTVNGASKNLVLITTGPAGASRPSTNLANYIDDVPGPIPDENRNGDDIFQTPTSTAYARDRLYVIP